MGSGTEEVAEVGLVGDSVEAAEGDEGLDASDGWERVISWLGDHGGYIYVCVSCGLERGSVF